MGLAHRKRRECPSKMPFLRWPDSRESFQGSRTEPPFVRIALRGVKRILDVNRKSEAIRANRSHRMKIEIFLRIDSRELIRANRPDSRCESPGHLSAIWVCKVWSASAVFGDQQEVSISDVISFRPSMGIGKQACESYKR